MLTRLAANLLAFGSGFFVATLVADPLNGFAGAQAFMAVGLAAVAVFAATRP